MRQIFSLMVVLFSLFYAQSAQSSGPATRFEHLSPELGLSRATVYSILQDRQGFLWFASQDGLYRYDGYNFKVFRHNPQDPHSISGNLVQTLVEDSKGRIWIGTRHSGLNRFDAKLERFVRYNHDDTDPNSLSNDGAWAIVEDSQNRLWIGTRGGGLNLFNETTGKFKHFRHDDNDPNSLTHDRVLTLLEDSQGDLWVGTGNGLDRLPNLASYGTNGTKKAHFIHYKHQPNNPNSLTDNRIRTLVEDKNGSIWVGTRKGLNRFDATNTNTNKTGQFHQFKHLAITEDPAAAAQNLSNNYIRVLFEDSTGTLWVGTNGGGLNRYNAQQQNFTHFTNHEADANSISDNSIWSMHEDNRGIIWIGTYKGGVNKLNSKQNQFNHFKHQPSDPNSLSHSSVYAIVKDRNNDVWLGTSEGLNHYNHITGAFKRYFHQPLNPHSLGHDLVLSLLEDSEGTLWAGTFEGGLNRYDPDKKHFIRYKSSQTANSISGNSISTLFEDATNNLWVGTYGSGLNRYNRQTRQFEHFKNNKDNPHSLSNDTIRAIFEDSKGRLWLGTNDGLNLFDRQTGRFVAYKYHRNDQHSLSNNRVYTIVEDDKGHLWLGTHGGGLNKLNTQTMQFSQFRESDGLSNDIIYGIARDPKGLLWVSTDNGLSRFDPDKISFKNYDFNDGLQGNGFNQRAYFKAKDGEFFFGGSNGFNRFYPQNISDDPHRPTVVLTDFLVANQSVAINPDSTNDHNASDDNASDDNANNKSNPASFKLPQSIDSLEHLTLSYQQNLITFEFAALHFVNQMKNQFAYQLLGQDPNWITTDAKNRRATYSNLAPGLYTLRIKASNKDGYWNEEGKTLSIEVLPPWWRSTLAYVLYIVSILASSYSFYHYRTRSLILRAKELERSIEERTATVKQLMEQKDRMFANISHEFKTPLTLILNPMDAINASQNKQTIMDKVSMMKRNGHRLLRLVEQLLELSKIKSGNVDDQQQWQYYSLAQTLNVLLTSFQPLFDSNQIKVNHAKFDDVILHLKPDSLELMLTNLISNAVKYNSANGTITIDVQRRDTMVKIIVEDTGIGIDETNQALVFNRFTRAIEQHGKNIPGAGIGLALVKELALINGGQVELASTVGHGSTFTVTLPIDTSGAVAIKNMDELPDTTKMEIQSFADDQASESAIQPNTSPDANEPHNNKPQLLVIDDNIDMLKLLDDTLNPHYHCIFADNGTQGVLMAKEHLPDLVLSDVMMPCISGFEVLNQLKTDEMTSHIPVILLTAKGDVQSRIKGWENKADEYLEKPFNAAEMLARIDNLLSIRQLLSHRFQQKFSRSNNQTVTEQQPDAGISSEEEQIDKLTQKFCAKFDDVLNHHYKDEDLDVSILASAMAMSRRQLSRKIKSMLDMTLTEAIRAYRLKKAIELLKEGITPSLVAHEVGFSSHSYFSQCFKAHFGCAPSEHGNVG